MNRLSRLKKRLLAPVDNSWLVYLRIFFGAVILIDITRFFQARWIELYYIAQPLHFKYFGFEWVQAWPLEGMFIHFALVAILAVFVILGFQYRYAMPLLAIGFGYIFLLDQVRYLNHFYLFTIIAFLMSFMPANRSFSLDAVFHPEIRSTTTPTWTLWLIRFQLAIPYIYGGIAKITPDWLRGEPMRLWLYRQSEQGIFPELFTQEWFVYFMSYAGLLFDLAVIPMLLYKPTRRLAILLLLMFHVLNSQLWNIGMFPWMMLFATLIFFKPNTIRAIINKLLKIDKQPKPKPKTQTHSLYKPTKLLLPLLTIYVTLQLLLPFRHLLYPGNVHWNGYGGYFAWHMKLNNKGGAVLFLVEGGNLPATIQVDMDPFLPATTQAFIASHPDMLLQTAHYIDALMQEQGYGDVEVYAHAFASLNGRELQRIVDETVDLSTIERRLWGNDWVLPLTTPFRHSTDGYIQEFQQSEPVFEQVHGP